MQPFKSHSRGVCLVLGINIMIKACFFPGLFLPWSNVLHVEIAFLKFMLFLRYASSLLDFYLQYFQQLC